jgi:hypothetical protein
LMYACPEKKKLQRWCYRLSRTSDPACGDDDAGCPACYIRESSFRTLIGVVPSPRPRFLLGVSPVL